MLTDLRPVDSRRVPRRIDKDVRLQLCARRANDNARSNYVRVTRSSKRLKEVTHQSAGNDLMSRTGSRRHDEITVEQLVSIPIVGESLEILDRETRHADRHAHMLPP